MWPYLGKPGFTKTPLNSFAISTHFGNVRMHYRSCIWKHWQRSRTKTNCIEDNFEFTLNHLHHVVKRSQCISVKQYRIEKHSQKCRQPNRTQEPWICWRNQWTCTVSSSSSKCSKKILILRNLLDILQLLNFQDVEAANLVFTMQNLIVNFRPFTFRVCGFFHVNHKNH